MKGHTKERSNNRKTFADNNRLRKENGRLRKQVQKLTRLIHEFGLHEPRDPDDVEVEPELPATIDPRLECPKCNEQGKEINLGRITLFICSHCGYREKTT